MEKKAGTFSWNITVPPNTTALVYLPAAFKNEVLESGKKADSIEGINFKKRKAGKAIFEIGSETYSFKVKQQ